MGLISSWIMNLGQAENEKAMIRRSERISSRLKKIYESESKLRDDFFKKIEDIEYQWWISEKENIYKNCLSDLTVRERVEKAKKGYVEEMYNLGVIYLQGRGVEINKKLASEWFRAAAINGHIKASLCAACFYRGEMGFDKKRKTPIEEQKEIYYMHRAAEKGNALAQVRVGIYYQDGGTVLGKNEYAVFLWCEKAAKQGDKDGLCMMGNLHAWGEGAIYNVEKAATYWKQAAELGDVQAMYHLGLFYEGYFARKFIDINKAGYWFNEAAKRGDKKAQDCIREYYQDGMRWCRKR